MQELYRSFKAPLILCRAYCVTQLSRAARVGEAQRRASMLHNYTGAGHASVGVSCCATFVLASTNIMQCSVYCKPTVQL